MGGERTVNQKKAFDIWYDKYLEDIKTVHRDMKYSENKDAKEYWSRNYEKGQNLCEIWMRIMYTDNGNIWLRVNGKTMWGGGTGKKWRGYTKENIDCRDGRNTSKERDALVGF